MRKEYLRICFVWISILFCLEVKASVLEDLRSEQRKVVDLYEKQLGRAVGLGVIAAGSWACCIPATAFTAVKSIQNETIVEFPPCVLSERCANYSEIRKRIKRSLTKMNRAIDFLEQIEAAHAEFRKDQSISSQKLLSFLSYNNRLHLFEIFALSDSRQKTAVALAEIHNQIEIGMNQLIQKNEVKLSSRAIFMESLSIPEDYEFYVVPDYLKLIKGYLVRYFASKKGTL